MCSTKRASFNGDVKHMALASWNTPARFTLKPYIDFTFRLFLLYIYNHVENEREREREKLSFQREERNGGRKQFKCLVCLPKEILKISLFLSHTISRYLLIALELIYCFKSLTNTCRLSLRRPFKLELSRQSRNGNNSTKWAYGRRAVVVAFGRTWHIFCGLWAVATSRARLSLYIYINTTSAVGAAEQSFHWWHCETRRQEDELMARTSETLPTVRLGGCRAG